jgi:uroporphyrinogen decarboxylase
MVDAATQLTSKERVFEALNHRETDRIPPDFGSTGVTGISRKALIQLLDYCGFPHEDIGIYEIVQQAVSQI